MGRSRTVHTQARIPSVPPWSRARFANAAPAVTWTPRARRSTSGTWTPPARRTRRKFTAPNSTPGALFRRRVASCPSRRLDRLLPFSTPSDRASRPLPCHLNEQRVREVRQEPCFRRAGRHHHHVRGGRRVRGGQPEHGRDPAHGLRQPHRGRPVHGLRRLPVEPGGVRVHARGAQAREVGAGQLPRGREAGDGGALRQARHAQAMPSASSR